MSVNEPDDLAGVFGGGEIADVAAAIKRAYEAFVELEAAITGVERVRPVPGVLGLSGTIFIPCARVWDLAILDRSDNPGGLIELPGSSPADRLANEIRGDGD